MARARSGARHAGCWQGRIETEVEIAGSGPPLVYLHGPWGLTPDRAFIARLAAQRTPSMRRSFPAPAAAIPRRCTQLDDWLDLLVYYGELFDRLGLDGARDRRPFVRRFGRRRIRRRHAEIGQPAGPDRSRRTVARRPAGQTGWCCALRARPAVAVRRARQARPRGASSPCRPTPPSASRRWRNSSGRRPAPASSSGRSPTAA